MSAERVAASSRVRFEVTGWPSLLRNSAQTSRADPCSGRLLVRPYPRSRRRPIPAVRLTPGHDRRLRQDRRPAPHARFLTCVFRPPPVLTFLGGLLASAIDPHWRKLWRPRLKNLMVHRAKRVSSPCGSRIFTTGRLMPHWRHFPEGGPSARPAAPSASREPGPSHPLLARGRRRLRRLRLVLAAGLVHGLTRPGPRSGGDARLGRLGLGEMLGARPGHVPGPHRGVRRELHGWHGIPPQPSVVHQAGDAPPRVQ